MRLEEQRRTLVVPQEYEVLFYKAELTFQYQMVYDADKNCLVHLDEIDEEVKASLLEDWNFLGPSLDPEVASGIAQGNLDPITWKPFVKEQPLPIPITDYLLHLHLNEKMLQHQSHPSS